jgi:hypothetical protein
MYKFESSNYFTYELIKIEDYYLTEICRKILNYSNEKPNDNKEYNVTFFDING